VHRSLLLVLLVPLALSSVACSKNSAASAEAAASSQPTRTTSSPSTTGDAGPAAGGTSTPDASMTTTTDDSPEGRYRAWLASEKGMDEAEVVPWRPGMTGDWHFFFARGPAPGQKLHAAAVGPSAILTRTSTDAAWKDLLTSAEAVEVHSRIAWLNGMWMAVVPDTPHAQSVARKHPSINDHLTAPEVQEQGDSVVFTGWYAEPPAMMSFRYTVTAGPDGTTFERKKLADF